MGSRSLSPEAESFLALATRQDLADWLGITDRRLRFLLYGLSSSDKYVTFTIAKRKGGERTIQAPNPALKRIQKRLLSVFTELAPASGIAKGFVRGRSTVDHANRHRASRWIVLADIKDFFPSVNFGRVRGALAARPFGLPVEIATCVAQLCCKDGALPQGAPTSPVLANLICRSLDRALVRLAKANRCGVSRYADDVCISTSLNSVPPAIAVFKDGGYAPGRELFDVFTSNGFELNIGKFRVANRVSRQLVTGLVVNFGLSLPKEWRKQVRVLLHLIRKHGADRALEIAAEWKRAAFRGSPESIEQVMRGKINYAHYVDIRSGRKFAASLHRCYPGLRDLMPDLMQPMRMRLMAEGATDLLHLEAALADFNSRSELTYLVPRFKNFSGGTGDVELWETLLRIAKSEVQELTVGVFDCDNLSYLRKKGLEVGSFFQLGSKVYAMCLAQSPGGEDAFCIESLYPREQASRLTAEGRRLFFGDEFDVSTGIHLEGLFQREHPKKKAVVVSDRVVDITDGRSVLLSKMDFATMVHTASDPFSDMDFSGFLPTFQLLRDVVVHSQKT